jgi:hypothetical protein
MTIPARGGDEPTVLQLATELKQAQPWFGKYATVKV